ERQACFYDRDDRGDGASERSGQGASLEIPLIPSSPGGQPRRSEAINMHSRRSLVPGRYGIVALGLLSLVLGMGVARAQEATAISDLLIGAVTKSPSPVASRDVTGCLARLRAADPGIADQAVALALPRLPADLATLLQSAGQAALDAARSPDAT